MKKKNLPSDFKKCPRWLHFTLLLSLLLEYRIRALMIHHKHRRVLKLLTHKDLQGYSPPLYNKISVLKHGNQESHLAEILFTTIIITITVFVVISVTALMLHSCWKNFYINLQIKSIDWFQYECDTYLEWCKVGSNFRKEFKKYLRY